MQRKQIKNFRPIKRTKRKLSRGWSTDKESTKEQRRTNKRRDTTSPQQTHRGKPDARISLEIKDTKKGKPEKWIGRIVINSKTGKSEWKKKKNQKIKNYREKPLKGEHLHTTSRKKWRKGFKRLVKNLASKNKQIRRGGRKERR